MLGMFQKLCRKLLWKGLPWKKVIKKKNRRIFKNLQKTKKTIVVGFIKRKERKFLTTWISVLSLIVNYFGKQLKHFFLTKIIRYQYEIESDTILNDNEKIVEELNNFFQNAVSNLNIQEYSFIQSKYYHKLLDPVQRAIDKYKHHPSVLLIQSKISKGYKISLSAVSKSNVEKEIESINPKKLLPKTVSLQVY